MKIPTLLDQRPSALAGPTRIFRWRAVSTGTIVCTRVTASNRIKPSKKGPKFSGKADLKAKNRSFSRRLSCQPDGSNLSSIRQIRGSRGGDVPIERRWRNTETVCDLGDANFAWVYAIRT